MPVGTSRSGKGNKKKKRRVEAWPFITNMHICHLEYKKYATALNILRVNVVHARLLLETEENRQNTMKLV